MKANFWQLMLVTNRADLPLIPYLQLIEICIKSGITSVQLREKYLSKVALFDFAYTLKQLLDTHNIPLIINDDVDLCSKLDATGVHLGQSDTKISEARAILGADKIIGLSVNSIEQIQRSNSQPINYIGLSAIFPTRNKA